MSVQDCEYRFGPSRAYALVSVMLHGGAAVALGAASVPGTAAIGLFVLIAAHLLHDLRSGARRNGRRAVTGVRVREGAWHLLRGDAMATHPRPLRSAWVFGSAVLLCVGDRPWQRDVCIVLRDAMPADAFRHLRAATRSALDSAGAV